MSNCSRLFRFIKALVLLLLAARLDAADHRGVVSSNGQPIPGATVTAVQGERRIVTATDEAGRYAMEGLEPGAWLFQVEMFGFVGARREIQVGGESPTTEWVLELKPYSPPQPLPSPPTAFQSLELSPSAENDVLAGLAAPAPPEPAPPEEALDANEAFLVHGSMSRGLEAAREEEDVLAERRAELAERIRQVLSGAKEEAPAVFGEGGTAPGGSPGKGRALSKAANGGWMAGRSGRLAKAAARKASIASFGNRRARGQEGIRGAASLNLRNSALDARPFSFTGQTVPKPSYAQNRFNVMAGGPLRIPKLLETQRTFFFVNYSGTRSRNPFNAVTALPGLAERAGDFSQSQVREPVTIHDPAGRLPFPGNLVPQDRVSPAADGLLEFIPVPNQPGRVQNYQFVSSVRQNTDNFGLRLNQPLSRRDRLSFSLNLQTRAGEGLQPFGFRDETSGRGLRTELGWTFNLRRRLINNLRWSFNRNRSETLPFFSYKRNVAAELGIRGTSQEPINFGPPNLSFTNFGDLTDASPVLRRDQESSLQEGLTFFRGRHNLMLGGQFRRGQLNSRTDQNARGSFSFSGLSTSGFDSRNLPLPFTGFDFADFLLGLPQSSSVRFGSANTYFRGSAYAVWAQDDWRVRPNLTLNAGLRYEFFTPLKEKYGRVANLDIAPGFTGAAAVTPGAIGPYSGRFPDALIDPDRNNFSPRAGIAWKPVPKRRLQVRAGYGAFYDGSIYNRFATRLASQPPFANTASLTTSLARTLTLQDGFAAAPSAKVTNTFAVDRSYRVGYAQTWNLAVQQELPHALVVEAGYLGTKGTRLDIQRSPNRAAPGSPLTAEQRRLIGNAVGFTFDSSEGNSIYHAAQLRVTRRFRHGVSANGFYTWSKSIDNASSIGGGGASVAQNDHDLRAERGLSTFDRRHALTLSYVLSSPGDARGRVMPSGRWAAGLMRNWTLSGGLTLQTGQPFTARVLGNRADSGGTGVVGSGRADSTGASVHAGAAGRFFNLAAFTIPPAGRFGNAGRNTIPGPGLFSLNLSVGRSFRLGESRRWLEIRADSHNFTNHVSYTRLETVVNALSYGLAASTAPMRTVTATLRFRF